MASLLFFCRRSVSLSSGIEHHLGLGNQAAEARVYIPVHARAVSEVMAAPILRERVYMSELNGPEDDRVVYTRLQTQLFPHIRF